MNKAIVSVHGEDFAVTAPEGKTMVFDPSLLAHGVLVLGEYGPSGVKVAAFKDWTMATFEAEGYSIIIERPF
jgi:hypothetical protein